MNTPGSARLGSCQVSTVVEHPRHATRAQQALNATDRQTHRRWIMTMVSQRKLNLDPALWSLEFVQTHVKWVEFPNPPQIHQEAIHLILKQENAGMIWCE